jgi:uncharacterized protein (TIGR00251 family)
MWFKEENQYVQLRILAKPKSKRTSLVAIAGDELHISLHAKPHDGEANRVLIEFLAKCLDLPKSQIVLQKGEVSRHKVVLVPLNELVKQLITNPAELMGK